IRGEREVDVADGVIHGEHLAGGRLLLGVERLESGDAGIAEIVGRRIGEGEGQRRVTVRIGLPAPAPENAIDVLIAARALKEEIHGMIPEWTLRSNEVFGSAAAYLWGSPVTPQCAGLEREPERQLAARYGHRTA